MDKSLQKAWVPRMGKSTFETSGTPGIINGEAATSGTSGEAATSGTSGHHAFHEAFVPSAWPRVYAGMLAGKAGDESDDETWGTWGAGAISTTSSGGTDGISPTSGTSGGTAGIAKTSSSGAPRAS